MNLPVSDIVRVRIASEPMWPEGPGFGTLLLISHASILPRGDCLRYYTSQEHVAIDFGSRAEEYKAATVYFSQEPSPLKLGIGRWFHNPQQAELLGGPHFSSHIEAWQTIRDGYLSIEIDGESVLLDKLDFSKCLHLVAVAGVVNQAFQLHVKKASLLFNGQRFILLSGLQGATAQISYPKGGKAGTDITPHLGFQEGDAILTQGCEAESLSEALRRLQEKSNKWYGVTCLGIVHDQQIEEAAMWTQAQKAKIFGYASMDPALILQQSTTDIASVLRDKKCRRVIGIYAPVDSYAIVSVFARAFGVDFSLPHSTITLKFKVLPGVLPLSLIENQADVLRSKNMNYYTYFGENAMLAEGVMADGTFFDDVHGLDWFQSTIETYVFGLLYTSGKVPLNDKGLALLIHQVEKACDKAVEAGLLSPGVWNGKPLGQIKMGDLLPKGFYIYAESLLTQPQSERDKRMAPKIQILAKGSGSIHFVDIIAYFEA